MATQICVVEESHDWSSIHFLGTYYQRMREPQRLRLSMSQYTVQMVLYWILLQKSLQQCGGAMRGTQLV